MLLHFLTLIFRAAKQIQGHKNTRCSNIWTYVTVPQQTYGATKGTWGFKLLTCDDMSGLL